MSSLIAVRHLSISQPTFFNKRYPLFFAFFLLNSNIPLAYDENVKSFFKHF